MSEAEDNDAFMEQWTKDTVAGFNIAFKEAKTTAYIAALLDSLLKRLQTYEVVLTGVTQTDMDLNKEVEKEEKEEQFFDQADVTAEEFMEQLMVFKDRIDEFRKLFNEKKQEVEFPDGTKAKMNISTEKTTDRAGNVFRWVGVRIVPSTLPETYALITDDKDYQIKNIKRLEFFARTSAQINRKELPVASFIYLHRLYGFQKDHPTAGEALRTAVEGKVDLTLDSGSGTIKYFLQSYDFEHGTAKLRDGPSTTVVNLGYAMRWDHMTKKTVKAQDFIMAMPSALEQLEKFKEVLKGKQVKVKADDAEKVIQLADPQLDTHEVTLHVESFPFPVELIPRLKGELVGLGETAGRRDELLRANLGLLAFAVKHNKHRKKEEELAFEVNEFIQLNSHYLNKILLQPQFRLEEKLPKGFLIYDEKNKKMILAYSAEEPTVTLTGNKVVKIAELPQFFAELSSKKITQRGKKFPEMLYEFEGNVEEFMSQKGHSTITIKIGKSKTSAKPVPDKVSKIKTPHIVLEMKNFPFPVIILAERKFDDYNTEVLEFVVAHSQTKEELKFTVTEFVKLHELFVKFNPRQIFFNLAKTMPNKVSVVYEYNKVQLEAVVLAYYPTEGKVVLHPNVYTDINKAQIEKDILVIERNKQGITPQELIEILQKYKDMEIDNLFNLVKDKSVRGTGTVGSTIKAPILGLRPAADGFMLQLGNLPPNLWVPANVARLTEALELGDLKELDAKMIAANKVFSAKYDVAHRYSWIFGKIRLKGSDNEQDLNNENFIDGLGKKNNEWFKQGIPILSSSEVQALKMLAKEPFLVYVP